MKIAVKSTTYEVGLDEVKKMFAEKLCVDVEKVSVHYKIEEVGGDCMDRFRGVDTVTQIQVTVNG
jgi:hypothetical protein